MKSEMTVKFEVADAIIEMTWPSAFPKEGAMPSDSLIQCKVTDTAFDIPSPTAGQTQVFFLTHEQAGATAALIVTGDFEDPQFNEALYRIAEPAWKDVPKAFRPIP